VRFEVLTAVIIRILILRDVVSCSLVDNCRRFEGSRRRLEWRQLVIPNINDGSNRFRRNVTESSGVTPHRTVILNCLCFTCLDCAVVF